MHAVGLGRRAHRAQPLFIRAEIRFLLPQQVKVLLQLPPVEIKPELTLPYFRHLLPQANLLHPKIGALVFQ